MAGTSISDPVCISLRDWRHIEDTLMSLETTRLSMEKLRDLEPALCLVRCVESRFREVVNEIRRTVEPEAVND